MGRETPCNRPQNDPTAWRSDLARLRLAEHRVERNRLEVEFQISKNDSIRPKLEKMIDREQELIFTYFALKIREDKKNSEKHALKASFAILDLIMDKVCLEVSLLKNRGGSNLENFHYAQAIRRYIEKVQDMNNSAVDLANYSEEEGATIMTSISDLTNGSGGLLTSIDAKARALKNPTVFQLITTKLELIKNVLKKPVQEDFAKNLNEYEPAKKNYQKRKHEIKETFASFTEDHIRRVERKAPLITVPKVENSKALRGRAMANYGWIEQLSYLIPTAVLWILYQFSPLLGLIPLSLRVSQNILLIGSSTHLFVQNFFRNQSTASSR